MAEGARPRRRTRAANDPRRRPVIVKAELRLPTWQAALLEEAAAALSLSRSRWISALVASRLAGVPQFSREGELSLIQVHAELRRIRTELAMLRHRQGAAGGPIGSADLAAAIERYRHDLQSAIAEIRKAFARNRAYWRGADD